jgi:hypothetical protein
MWLAMPGWRSLDSNGGGCTPEPFGGCAMPPQGRFSRVAASALALFMMSGAALAAAQPGAVSVVVVDARSDAGALKALRGVNGAPNLTFLGSSPLLPMPLLNETRGYLAAHVNLVRTHDSGGVGDIDSNVGNLPPLIPEPADKRAAIAAAIERNVIFRNLGANPDNPASYHFGPTDKLIEGIRRIHAQVLFRLGRSGMTTAPPPANVARYADIIRHIVLHYDRGWDHGMHDAVKYWEVWNEPDLGKIFWRGTPQQYYALYAAAARAVKSADPHAQVGGPAIALVNQKTAYRQGFLAFVRAHHLPLDFFSWHWYSVGADDPYQFAEIARSQRALLDRYGFTHTRSFLDEWNYDFRQLHTTPPIQVASFVASALIYMQYAPIDQSAIYRADHFFNVSGTPRTPSGQVLIDFGALVDTPIRLRSSGTDHDGFAVLAARNADGSRIRVLVSNYQIPAADMGPRRGGLVWHVDHLFSMRILPRRSVHYPPVRRYELSVRHLPAGRYRFIRQRLTAAGTSTMQRVLRVSGTIRLGFTLPAYVVDAIEIVRLPARRPPAAQRAADSGR